MMQRCMIFHIICMIWSLSGHVWLCSLFSYYLCHYIVISLSLFCHHDVTCIIFIVLSLVCHYIVIMMYCFYCFHLLVNIWPIYCQFSFCVVLLYLYCHHVGFLIVFTCWSLFCHYMVILIMLSSTCQYIAIVFVISCQLLLCFINLKLYKH